MVHAGSIVAASPSAIGAMAFLALRMAAGGECLGFCIDARASLDDEDEPIISRPPTVVGGLTHHWFKCLMVKL